MFQAYYGGEARCEAEARSEFDESELVCGACSDVSRAQMCPKHGADFLEYKCRYCCSVAVFFCFGTTHFCNPCHDDFQRVTNIPKNELPSCPAGRKYRFKIVRAIFKSNIWLWKFETQRVTYCLQFQWYFNIRITLE